MTDVVIFFSSIVAYFVVIFLFRKVIVNLIYNSTTNK